MNPITWHLGVLAVVANAYNLTEADVLGRSRQKRIALARQVCYYIHEADGHTLSDIGEAYGRDHSTVSYGKASIERKRRADADFAARLQSILTACINCRPAPQVYEITIPASATVNITGGNLTKIGG